MTAVPGGSAADAGPARERVVFFGSGSFALPLVAALAVDPTLEIVAVVTAPDRPAGRGGRLRSTPVAARAVELGLPRLQPERLRPPETVAALAALRPRLGILADYGRIVPASILDLPARGFLNVHPSLLPRHRGASPIAAAIIDADAATGVTIIRMDEGVDSGPIVASARLPLTGRESAPELETQLGELGAALLTKTTRAWLAGTLAAKPQDETAATFTRPLRREDGRLDPARPAAELERRVRALQPWPGAFFDTALGRLSIDRASVVAGSADDRPGTLEADGDGLALATVDGRLRLDELRLAGARRMSGAELRRGHPGLAGARAEVGAV